MQRDPKTNQAFFSYRRYDGPDNIKNIKDLFEECSGLNAFMDLDELRSGNFQETLSGAIRACYVFMPIVTEAYIKFAFEGGRDTESDFCLKEYREAILKGKKIGPILVNTSGNGRKVSYDEAITAALALDSADPEALKVHLATLKGYLFSLNGVFADTLNHWNKECSEKLSVIVFDSFCNSKDVPFYKEHLAHRVKDLNPLTVFGDFADLALTVKDSFVPLDLVRQLTEKEKQDRGLKPDPFRCSELAEKIMSDRFAVLVGDAGQGKSTIAKRLFIELAEEAAESGLSRDKLFPLFYECRRLEADKFYKEDAFITELANDAGLKPAAIR